MRASVRAEDVYGEPTKQGLNEASDLSRLWGIPWSVNRIEQLLSEVIKLFEPQRLEAHLRAELR